MLRFRGMTIALTPRTLDDVPVPHAPVEGSTSSRRIRSPAALRRGLTAGLAIDTVLTLLAIAYLSLTRTLAHGVKLGLLCIITFSTGFAVLSNLDAIIQMGIAPWSGSL
jgi:hypothetical protein